MSDRTRVCSNPACPNGPGPQPASNFYRTKYRCKRCQREAANLIGKRSRERRAASPYVVDREHIEMLPIGPWIEWLNRKLSENGRDIGALSAALGISERVMHRWFHDNQKTVQLDAIDRALCHYGMPGLLRELWPHLYQFDDQEDVAA